MALPLIYRTLTMLAALEQMLKVTNFLRDRYFPTNENTDIFETEDVLMDIRQGNTRMAPVVLPKKKGKTVAREGYKTERMTPPLVAPQRTLTLDDLESRGFGEALFGSMTTEEREAAILARDLYELDLMHDAREEYIAAKCILNNGYILPQYADEYGTDSNIPYEIRFYDEEANPSHYTPAIPWGEKGCDIYSDLGMMVRMLTMYGKPASDFVASPDVMDVVINDDKIYKMLDNKGMNFGSFDPAEVPEGASYYGKLNVAGKMISLFSYDAQFVDDISGEINPIIPSGQCVLTAPNSGRGLYGSVKQIEDDDKFHSYAGKRIPKFMTDKNNDIRTLRMASRPLYVPSTINPWISSDVF